MAKKNKKKGFYSTDPNFELPFEDLNLEKELPMAKQRIRIWLERKHRGGKEASIIKGLEMSIAEMKEIAKELKTKCGTGGSVIGDEILIQGDHREKIKTYFMSIGVDDVKLAGS